MYGQGEYTQAPNQDFNQNYNQGYQQYNQPYQPQSGLEEPVSFGEWMLTFFIMMVPCLNIIMMFIWAFGKDTKKSKSNYFKAALVWTLISLVISMVIAVIVAMLSVSAASVINSVF